ncbi:MAG: DUF4307 domain-containing protein [Propionibacteriales bacterium]|nr:DUF4307 domain-containing protein [Propionibacteriales bacterium]
MAERYGVVPTRRQRLPLVLGVLVSLVLLAWLLWAAWSHSTPAVAGGLTSYDVVSSHQVRVVVDVSRQDGDPVTCTVSAQAEDHVVVGEDDVTFPAGPARTVQTTMTLRTEREATSVAVTDCRAGSGGPGARAPGR